MVQVRLAAYGLAPALALALALSGCRDKPSPASVDTDAGAGAAASAPADEPKGEIEGTEDVAIGDAQSRFRDAEPKVELDRDGPVDPSCTGAEIAFAAVVVDPRCAIGSARAKQLRKILERDGGAPLPFRQDAKVAEDGRVVVRLINTGTAPVTLPLSYSSKLPAFTVLAEDDRHTIYELEPPRFEAGIPGAPDASVADERAHFARIVLAPSAVATATITIQPAIARVLARGAGVGKGADGGPSAPGRLARGKYVLHVGELLTDVEVGAPARVTWTLP